MGKASRSERRDAEFSEYLAARQPALLRIAYLISGDQNAAEDLLQNSLAKLYLAWDKINDRNTVDAYVRRIMVNENNSLWRRAWKRREYSSDELPESEPHLDRYDDGTNDELWRLVRTLPPKARSVLVLRYYEQLSEAETADLLGISVGTVKSQCSRAIATMRDRVPAELHPRHREEAP